MKTKIFFVVVYGRLLVVVLGDGCVRLRRRVKDRFPLFIYSCLVGRYFIDAWIVVR